MSIEDKVLALIEEGNPIPDPETIETLPAEPAAYLANLQQRSSEVVQLEEKREARDRRGSWWIAIAAVVVVLLGVAVFVLTQGDDDAPVATQPPADGGTIEGYWAGEEADFYFGESEYAIVIDGALSDSGTYEDGVREPDNRIVTITSGSETVDCTPGDVAIINYDFVGVDTVQLSGTPLDDCGLRPLLDIETLRPTDPFEIPSPAATTSDLEGSWASGDVAVVLEGEDYQFVVEGALVDSGTFTPTGPSTLAFRSDGDSPGCSPGVTGRWSYEIGDGLSLIAIDEPCLFRTGLTPLFEPGEFTSTDEVLVDGGEFELSGSWGAETDEVTFEAGIYSFVVGGETVNQGTYEILESPYRLALTPDAADETCGPAEYEFALAMDTDVLVLLGPGDASCDSRQALAERDLLPVDSP